MEGIDPRMRIATDKFAVRARHLGRPRARPQASESAARADGARRRENRERDRAADPTRDGVGCRLSCI